MARSSRSRWSDLAVHDGPIFAFTMVRNSVSVRRSAWGTSPGYGAVLAWLQPRSWPRLAPPLLHGRGVRGSGPLAEHDLAEDVGSQGLLYLGLRHGLGPVDWRQVQHAVFRPARQQAQ